MTETPSENPVSANPVSIGELLGSALHVLRRADCPGPRLDAELLLAHCLQVSRVMLTAHPERSVPARTVDEFRGVLARRAAGVPLAHLTGVREFYGHEFTVTPDVLIPRPETELLVEAALAWLAEEPPGGRAAPARVLDLCTGSGCLAITLALETPGPGCLGPASPGSMQLWASDLSPLAVDVARANARRHGMEGRIQWLEGDLLAPVATSVTVDLVICNPPYVATDDPRLAPDVAQYEPALALRDVHDGDGLGFYRRLAVEVPPRLAPAGALLLEVGENQAGAVQELFATTDLEVAAIHRDLAGIERALMLRKKSTGACPESDFV